MQTKQGKKAFYIERLIFFKLYVKCQKPIKL